MGNIKKVILAYSGGLDTSIIIPWLKENYDNPEVICVSGNVGQDAELEGLEERAKRLALPSCTLRISRKSLLKTMSSPPSKLALFMRTNTCWAPLLQDLLSQNGSSKLPRLKALTPSATAAPARATTRYGLSWRSRRWHRP